MSDRSEAKSRVQRFARSAGASLAKGKPPRRSSGLDAYLDEFPDEILLTLEGFIQRLAIGKTEDPAVLGYQFLLQGQLERLRYQTDRGLVDAIRLVEEFQDEVARHVAAGRMDAEGLSMIGSALCQAGIVASKELIAAIGRHSGDASRHDAAPDLASALEEMATQCGGAPFALANLLTETGHAMPIEARAMMATVLAAFPNPAVREAAILLLLDPEPAVRAAAMRELQSKVSGLTPPSLRRLITMRNWLPEVQRGGVDALIRAARAKGIECAPWREAATEVVLASAIDGSGAQGFLIVTKAGRRKRLSSALLKIGVSDAWAGPPETKASLQDAIEQAGSQTAMVSVSRTYLDRVIRNRLAQGLAAGLLPPTGLLQVAEAIGGADWQPEATEWRDALGPLLADLPPTMLEPEAVRSILADSDAWGYVDGIAESWFEDDQEVAPVVARILRQKRQSALRRILTEVIAPRRDKWAERFVGTAHWLREAPGDAELPWREFAILANALTRGDNLARIPLMRGIAERTMLMHMLAQAQFD
jgi:hypothetical protein